MNSAIHDEILTVEEVAARLRVKASWVYGHADMLGAFHLGKYLRFSWKHVLECLDQHNSRVDVGIEAQRPSSRPVDAQG